jgi:hypothetical protein
MRYKSYQQWSFSKALIFASALSAGDWVHAMSREEVKDRVGYANAEKGLDVVG